MSKDPSYQKAASCGNWAVLLLIGGIVALAFIDVPLLPWLIWGGISLSALILVIVMMFRGLIAWGVFMLLITLIGNPLLAVTVRVTAEGYRAARASLIAEGAAPDALTFSRVMARCVDDAKREKAEGEERRKRRPVP